MKPIQRPQHTLIFVYGTLRPTVKTSPRASFREPSEARQLRRRLLKEAEHLGRGRSPGQLFMVRHHGYQYPAARFIENCTSAIVGDIYRIKGAVPRLLVDLDRYEGCDLSQTHHREYQRTKIWVTPDSDKQKSLLCWAYEAVPELKKTGIIHSGDWLLG